jgi:transposase
MARYKEYCYEQAKLIPIAFSKQIQFGTFEYTLSYLVDHIVDMSLFEGRFHNDETGAPAYDPAVLLKIVLFGYSRGLMTSRSIEQACRENVVFMALSADSQPHYTTLAHFISSMGDVIEPVFRDVLLYCDGLGLIGKEMFAIDGCKLPSNASKEWSGTKAELHKKRKKLGRAVARMLKLHRERDKNSVVPEIETKEKQYCQKLRQHVAKLNDWLAENDDKIGKSGKAIKSNVTDNESAKMKTSHGVIQGYDGVAAVDAKHQIIVHAEAYGQAQEHDLLLPMVEGIDETFKAMGEEQVFNKAKLTADSGFHNAANLQQLHERKIDAYIADTQMRKRDPRFIDTDKYRARARKEKQAFLGSNTNKTYSNKDFDYDEGKQTCVCPAGKSLYRSGSNINMKGYLANKFKGTKRDCVPCPVRHKCLKFPDKTPVRQVAFFHGQTDKQQHSLTQKMREKIDSALGRLIYDKRVGTVEPVFGNHRNHGRDRFTLRGKEKVNVQWLLYSIVHNMGKIHHYGEGFT